MNVNQKSTMEFIKKKYNRMLIKDCIMKKIKFKFFKYFVNQYMINFVNFINSQKIYNLGEIIYFSKMENYFLLYANLQQNFDWNFLGKTIFELFHDHSDTNLDQLYILFTHNKELFNILTGFLDPDTRFVILQPFKIVFNKFLESDQLINGFMANIKADLIGRKFRGKLFLRKFVNNDFFMTVQ